MKILVIGSGAREHALVHTFFRQGHTVYCHPGNPGIHTLATPLKALDFEELCDLVKKKAIDLTVVGAEAPLEKGIRDLFDSQGLLLFGPRAQAAQLETSKAWAKQFMLKYRIPTASFEICGDSISAQKAACSLFSAGKKAMVKASGLAGGKGVFYCHDEEQALAAIERVREEKIYGKAGREIVIEEALIGAELTFQTLTNGQWAIPLLTAQDHKRLFDDDLGPNTGGMGAYAPVDVPSDVQEAIQQTIVHPTLRGLQQENILFQGILYFGLMLTKEGPKVLEYNCRFGDPEAQAILPLLESDLATLMLQALDSDAMPPAIQWAKGACCAVVLASQGYPESTSFASMPIPEMPQKKDVYPNNLKNWEFGEEAPQNSHLERANIVGVQGASEDENFEEKPTLPKTNSSSCLGIYYFHAATGMDERGQIIATGGRVLTVTGVDRDLDHARLKVYSALEEMDCQWAHFRKDIGRVAQPLWV